MPTVPITDGIRKAAQGLLDEDATRPRARLRFEDRKRLKAIADGERNVVDVGWWRATHGPKYVHTRDLKDAAENRAKVEKIKAMADPARNPNEPQRKVAEDMLAKFKPKRPPSAPGLDEHDRREAAIKEALDAQWPKTAEEWEARKRAVQAERAAKRAAAKARKAAQAGPVSEPAEPTPNIRHVANVRKTAAMAPAPKPERAPDATKPSPNIGRAANVSDSVATPEPVSVAAASVRANIRSATNVRPKPVDALDPSVSDSVAPVDQPEPKSGRNANGYAQEEPVQPKRNATGNTPERVVRANAERAAARARARAGRKCEVCGKRLTVARSTARFCGPTCRSKAFRAR
jgi:hypothetical protein